MCTVSWRSSLDGGYQLFFNRDEQRSRPRAKRPQEFYTNGRRYIAPIDEKSGGSWIAVNDLGVCAFLLNNYEAANGHIEPAKPFRSRGEIPLSLCGENGIDRSADALNGIEKERFPPFFAGMIGPNTPCQIYGWDGRQFEKLSLELPFLTTSSFQSKAVQAYRKDRYLEVVRSSADEKALFANHCDSAHENWAFNPLMSRTDAETHCISSISVDSKLAKFEYREVDPLQGSLRSPVSIELRLTTGITPTPGN